MVFDSRKGYICGQEWVKEDLKREVMLNPCEFVELRYKMKSLFTYYIMYACAMATLIIVVRLIKIREKADRIDKKCRRCGKIHRIKGYCLSENECIKLVV